MWKLIGVIIACTCFYGVYKLMGSIHVPKVPAPVALPLGEQNRTESVTLRANAEAYIERTDVSLGTLPKTAWCSEGAIGLGEELILRCVWHSPETNPPYIVANVAVPLPISHDISRWQFKRETLQAVAVPKDWLVVNFIALFVCVLLTFLGGLIALLALTPVRSGYSDICSVDHGL